jgi:histidinol-phosphatase (PHP family)
VATGQPLEPLPIESLPLDAHLHTDASTDSNVPIDAYATLARQQGVAELAITDHLDFDPRYPNYAPRDHKHRERVVRAAAERWDGRPAIRFGVEITYERIREAEIRSYLADHAYDYVIGSVHIGHFSPLGSAEEAARWCQGRTHREASGWYWEEVEAAIHSGLFDTIGHLDFIKRYLVEHLGRFDYEEHADIYERLLSVLVETGAALEVNSSGLRQAAREPYPPPAAVERYRELGGKRVVAGSDAHRAGSFASGLTDVYRAIRTAGFEALAFRRGSDPVWIELAAQLSPEPTR